MSHRSPSPFRAILAAAFPGATGAAPVAVLDPPGFDESLARFDESIAGLREDVARFTSLTRSLRTATAAAFRRRLDGTTVVFTGGSTGTPGRADLAAANGFRCGTRVTDTTELVVVGTGGASTAQHAKAVAASIPTIDEAEFWGRLDG